MSEDNKCPICKDVFNDKVSHEPCGHEFCKSCINRWYQVLHRIICPLCRTVKRKNVEREINSYFESQDERHDLKFILENQTEDFTIREDSLNLIINEENYYNHYVQAHPKTLKMLLDNNIDISIYLKIRSFDEKTCVQIKMNFDEILRDGKIYINLNLKLDEDSQLIIYEINTKKELVNAGIERLYYKCVMHEPGCNNKEINELIYSQSLLKTSFISSLISNEGIIYSFDLDQYYREFDLKIEQNNENTILKPGLLLLNFNGSEEHTSELQSRQYLVCRLLLEKKKKKHTKHPHTTNLQH